MPAFQPLNSAKRKSEYNDESSRKKIALDSAEEYWMVQWRKHKTWDGDAILVSTSSKATLYDSDGRTIAIGKVEWPLSEGKTFSIANKDIELDRPLSRNEYLSGRAFGSSSTTECENPPLQEKPTKQFVPPKINYSALPNREPTTARRDVPLQPIALTIASGNSPVKAKPADSHWTANWRKPQNKKHQTWDGDAYISLADGKLVMMSEEGKLMGSTPWKGDLLVSGYRTFIGGKEVELDNPVQASQLPDVIGSSNDNAHTDEAKLSKATDTFDRALESTSVVKFVAPTSFYGTPVKRKPKGPLHDPEAENAIVMKAPTKEHIRKFNKK
ncbi:hypothetical protein H0H81_008304 [Sphagnurus paluster]|uniref:Uncharacterized protein n=1 Tax=Sphagnurus paluster TaxID=117069 RepID=A0A9P7K353_9AGAR|nr:hypothetical protein H0H81_008304 [Sphagnurus paluster]